MTTKVIEEKLGELVEDLIRAVRAGEPRVTEGTVMTRGAPRYRRLDLGGRALAYVRRRPKKRAVRIDVPGLWSIPRSRLSVPSATGATLVVRSELDVPDAVRALLAARPR